ncbi:MAG: hypothetical protein A2138_17275 [Deltaproteobacteria bacterium RBG_16_71_12]|nr:MAG: hypothetical protein A2138_17275 [Deltaproteobacteria bacterium RBG_16_71_12]
MPRLRRALLRLSALAWAACAGCVAEGRDADSGRRIEEVDGGAGDADAGGLDGGTTAQDGGNAAQDGGNADSGSAVVDGGEVDGGDAFDGGVDTTDGGTDEDGGSPLLDGGPEADGGAPCARGDAGPEEAIPPLLFSTLDDHEAVVEPVYGAGSIGGIQTTPPEHYVPGVACNGVQLDAPTDSVGFPKFFGGTYNFDHDTGTLDLWWRTDWDHTDGVEHILFTTNGVYQVGGLQIVKGGAADGNALRVIVIDEDGAFVGETSAAADDYALSAGVWTRLRVTWEFTVAVGERNVRLYLDGGELPASHGTPTTGPVAMPAVGPNESLLFGRYPPEPPTGYAIDEVRVYDQAIQP